MNGCNFKSVNLGNSNYCSSWNISLHDIFSFFICKGYSMKMSCSENGFTILDWKLPENVCFANDKWCIHLCSLIFLLSFVDMSAQYVSVNNQRLLCTKAWSSYGHGHYYMIVHHILHIWVLWTVGRKSW